MPTCEVIRVGDKDVGQVVFDPCAPPFAEGIPAANEPSFATRAFHEGLMALSLLLAVRGRPWAEVPGGEGTKEIAQVLYSTHQFTQAQIGEMLHHPKIPQQTIADWVKGVEYPPPKKVSGIPIKPRWKELARTNLKSLMTTQTFDPNWSDLRRVGSAFVPLYLYIPEYLSVREVYQLIQEGGQNAEYYRRALEIILAVDDKLSIVMGRPFLYDEKFIQQGLERARQEVEKAEIDLEYLKEPGDRERFMIIQGDYRKILDYGEGKTSEEWFEELRIIYNFVLELELSEVNPQEIGKKVINRFGDEYIFLLRNLLNRGWIEGVFQRVVIAKNFP